MASEGPDLRQVIEEYKNASPEDEGTSKSSTKFPGYVD